MNRSRSYSPLYNYAVWIIMLIALALRFHIVLSMDYQPLVFDQLEYVNLTLRWLESGIYAYRDTMPNTLVTPGLPVFLAAVFSLFGYHPLEHGLMAVRLSQCFIGVGAVWFMYKLGARLFHPATGVLAAFFAAVYSQYVMSATLILTEVLFLTCFTAFLYLQVKVIQENRPGDHILMGVLLAVTVLIRPNILPLAVIPYVFLWIRHRKLFLPMIVRAVAAFAVVMMPWWIRNFITFHEFIPIAKGESGNPFLGGTDPYDRGTIDWSNINPEDQFAEGVRRLKQGLREDPWLWIRWYTVGKFKVFFFHRWVGPYPLYIPKWLDMLELKLHYLLACAGWVSLAVMSFFNRSAAYLFVTGLLLLAIHSCFVAVDRYSYGMMPFLMLGLAQAVAGSLRFIVSRKKNAAGVV